MIRNVGAVDRLVRFLAGALLLTCSVMAPLPLVARALGFGLPGLYVLLTALRGQCLGYRLLGRSTCSVARDA